jgi:hypothetical protein
LHKRSAFSPLFERSGTNPGPKNVETGGGSPAHVVHGKQGTATRKKAAENLVDSPAGRPYDATIGITFFNGKSHGYAPDWAGMGQEIQCSSHGRCAQPDVKLCIDEMMGRANKGERQICLSMTSLGNLNLISLWRALQVSSNWETS